MRLSARLWNSGRKAEEFFNARGKAHKYWTRNRIYDVFYKTGFTICAVMTLFGVTGILYNGTRAVMSQIGPEADEARKKMRAAEIAKKQQQALQYLENQEKFDNIKPPSNPDV